jgi:hypothetical protein
MSAQLHPLDRGLITVAGEDRVAYLQGLVSNDVARVAPDRAIYAAFLTPQGKYLEDFVVADLGDDRLALEVTGDAERRAAFLKRLTLYKLRSKVTLTDESADWRVFALTGDGALEAVGLSGEAGEAAPVDGGLAIVDPRLPALGARLIVPAAAADGLAGPLGVETGDEAAYHAHRLALGVPDGAADLEREKTTLLEANLDALNAISWDKGCYMGQELTARMRYRGLVKKRLVPVAIEGQSPPAGTDVTSGGRTVGALRSSKDGIGLALLRLDAMENEDLAAGEAKLTIRQPAYALAS